MLVDSQSQYMAMDIDLEDRGTGLSSSSGPPCIVLSDCDAMREGSYEQDVAMNVNSEVEDRVERNSSSSHALVGSNDDPSEDDVRFSRSPSPVIVHEGHLEVHAVTSTDVVDRENYPPAFIAALFPKVYPAPPGSEFLRGHWIAPETFQSEEMLIVSPGTLAYLDSIKETTSGGWAPYAPFDVRPLAIDTGFLRVSHVKLHPLTEIWLLAILEWKAFEVEALLEVMLQHGMSFRLSWNSMWGQQKIAANAERRTNEPRPNWVDGDNFLIGERQDSLSSFGQLYQERVRWLLRQPYARRLVAYGGLAWRLVIHFGSKDIVRSYLEGPSEAYTVWGERYTAGSDRESECPEDEESDLALKLLLGFTALPGNVSLWPSMALWRASYLWNGSWSSSAETWFQDMLTRLHDGELTPRTSVLWYYTLRGRDKRERGANKKRLGADKQLATVRTYNQDVVLASALHTPGILNVAHKL